MERRSFLKSAAGAITAAYSLSIPQFAAAETVPEEPQTGDALNPTGIRVGGIRMIPVCGGKYKVWTKRLGSAFRMIIWRRWNRFYPRPASRACRHNLRTSIIFVPIRFGHCP